MFAGKEPGETPIPEVVAVTVTGPLNPLRLVNEMIVLFWNPKKVERLVRDAATLKSCTLSVIDAWRDREPLLP